MVQRDIPGSHKDDERRHGHQSERGGRAVFEQLVAHGGIEEQDPGADHDGRYMYTGETLCALETIQLARRGGAKTDPSDGAIEGEASDGEDFEKRDKGVAEQEELHFAAADGGLFDLGAHDEEQGDYYGDEGEEDGTCAGGKRVRRGGRGGHGLAYRDWLDGGHFSEGCRVGRRRGSRLSGRSRWHRSLSGLGTGGISVWWLVWFIA